MCVCVYVCVCITYEERIQKKYVCHKRGTRNKGERTEEETERDSERERERERGEDEEGKQANVVFAVKYIPAKVMSITLRC